MASLLQKIHGYNVSHPHIPHTYTHLHIFTYVYIYCDQKYVVKGAPSLSFFLLSVNGTSGTTRTRRVQRAPHDVTDSTTGQT